MNEYKFQVSDKFGDLIAVYRANTLEELKNAREDMLFHLQESGCLNLEARPAQSNGDQPETEQIDVEEIEFMGKNRWVVKGGWAKEYGITVWPEVLEKAGLLPHLKMDEPNKPQKSWVATYTKKPKKDGSGMTADKVISLEPA